MNLKRRWFPGPKGLPWLAAGSLAVGWLAAVPITRLSHEHWSLWLHVPLMAISLGVLTVGAALGGVTLAELSLRRRQQGDAGG